MIVSWFPDIARYSQRYLFTIQWYLGREWGIWPTYQEVLPSQPRQWQTQVLVQKAMWTKDWCLKDRKTTENVRGVLCFCVQTCWTDFCLMFFLLMLGEYSSFVEFVWVVWFQVMTSFVCHWWCMSLNVSSSGTDKPQNLVGWQAMKMIRAMWFTLFGSILRHWHSNIAAGCNASKEISSAMRRCPVIRWLHVLRSKISLHSLGVFLDIFLIIDGHFLNFGRFCYNNQLAVGKLAVICPTWAATFLGFLPVFFSGTRWSQSSKHGGLNSQQLKITKK